MRIKRSISTRLSIFIIIFTGILFVSSSFALYFFSKELIRKEAFTNADILLDNINNETNAFFLMVSLSVDNTSWVVSENTSNIDSLYAITNHILSNSSTIKGSTIALEPGYSKKLPKYFAPYSYYENGQIKTKQLGNGTEDYTKEVWYTKAKEAGKGVWSDPYFDNLGAEVMMTTYAKPLYDDNGKFFGVITADISLDWLGRVINNAKPYEEASMTVISRKGKYIVNENSSMIMKSAFADADGVIPDTTLVRVKGEMINGEEGWAGFKTGNKNMFIFYRPIEALNWSLAMVCPENAIFDEVNQLAIWMGVVLFFSLIILFVFCYRIIRRVMLPLKTLTSSADIIAEGNFHAPLPKITTGDELSQLCYAFESMQRSLSSYISQLKKATSAKERIESELRIGSKIQLEMLPHALPKFKTSKEIDLSAALQPAKEVGGDLYDYIEKGNKLYFIMGDVAGKGVPAALLMAMITSLFHLIATIFEKPEKIVSEINRAIIEKNSSDMFATLVVGVISLDTMKLHLCNAGHNPPILIPNGKLPAFMTVTPNLPVGVTENMAYKPDAFTISDGDTLLFYTDGVTEAEDKDKNLFGEERLLDMLSGISSDSAQLIITGILAEVRNFVKQAGQSDDITAMAIRIGGPPPQTLVIKNRIEEIEKLAPFTEAIGEKAGIDAAEVLSLNLVLEEAVSNIIMYGYKVKREDNIKITCTIYNETLTLIISDSADEFDITRSAPEVDITQTAEERPIGGLGIYLINKIMDSVEYFNICGSNTMILKKNISKKQ